MIKLAVICILSITFFSSGVSPTKAGTPNNSLQSQQKIYLAKSIKPTFNRVATAKPPVARTRTVRTPPQPRKFAARPAPAPKAFGARMSPGGTKIASARLGRGLTGAKRSNSIATRESVRAGTRGLLSRNAFNNTVNRGALRPKFNRSASRQSNLGSATGGRSPGRVLRAASISKGSNSLTRTFNNASRANLGAPKFNRASVPRSNVRSNINRSVQKGRATQAFRKAAAGGAKFDGGIRGGKPRIRGFTKHGINQVISRGVSPRSLRDAVANPGTGSKSFVAGANKGTTRFVGRNATVVLNNQGRVVTAWPRTPKNWAPIRRN